MAIGNNIIIWKKNNTLGHMRNRKKILNSSQQTRGAELVLIKCWATVGDDGPTLNQHWFSVSCLAGRVLKKCGIENVNY